MKLSHESLAIGPGPVTLSGLPASPASPPIPEGSIAAFPPMFNVNGQNASPLDDEYAIWQGGPGDAFSDVMLPLAWRTHQEGYSREGLAKQAAVTEEGFLCEAIDKSRHLKEGITYLVAQRPGDPDDRATSRLIDAHTYEELPTYGLVKEGLNSRAIAVLKSIQDEGNVQLKELGALSKTSLHTSRGVQEVIRKLLRDTVSDGVRQPVRLYCSMVEPVRRGLARSISAENLMPIGKTVILEENGFRKETPLTPLIINPDQFVPNILKAYKQARNSKQKALTLNSLLFFTHGLQDNFMNEEVAEFVTQLKAASSARASREAV